MSENNLRAEEASPVGPGQLKVCWGGVKVEGGKRLECGEPVDDPRTIEEVNRLINEFMGGRVERHKDVLLSESTTPFDKAINELSNWLALMEQRLRRPAMKAS